jgi:hypothetical protein
MRAFKTYICVEKNYVFADLRKFDVRQKYLGSQIANLQIAKIYGLQMANLQISTFEEGPQIFSSPQICGFEICGTYLRTTVFLQLNHSCSPSPHYPFFLPIKVASSFVFSDTFA